MRRHRRKRSVITMVTLSALVLAVVPFEFASGQVPQSEVLFSVGPNREVAVSLDEATVWGEVAIFVASEEPGIEDVSFFIDDPTMASPPYSVDTEAPYDLEGSVGPHPAAPAMLFDTSSLSDGTHNLTVRISRVAPLPDVVLSADFDVDNDRLVTIDGLSGSAIMFHTEIVTASLALAAGPVDEVVLLLDEAEISGAVVEPFEIEWDTTLVPDGDYELRARADFTGGGSEYSLPIAVTVDNGLSGTGRVIEAFEREMISVDEHALFGVYALWNPAFLSPRYQSTVAEDDGTWAAGYFLQDWDLLDSQTQETIDEFLTIVEDLIDPAELLLVDPAFPQCYRSFGDFVRVHVLFGKYFHCWTQLGRWEFYYNIASLDVAAGINESDNDADGIPDYIQRIAESLDAAWDVYDGMGFELPDAETINVPIHDTPGLVAPDPFGTVRIELPFAAGADYLPRHELFHVVQYEYLSVFPHSLSSGSIWWWMEATAEWAAHQASGFQGDPQPFEYANLVNHFLSRPAEHLTTLDPRSSTGRRQYGAFLLAEFLEEEVGPTAIRETWELIGEGSFPLLAIDGVADGLTELLTGFTRANYLLESWDAIEPYTDPHASVWRSRLQAVGGSTAGDALGGARPSRLSFNFSTGGGFGAIGWRPVEYGGAVYVDFVPPDDENGYLVFNLMNMGGVHYQILAFDQYPDLCQPPIEIVGQGGYTHVKVGSGCEFATLVATGMTNGLTEHAAWQVNFASGDYPDMALMGAINGGSTSFDVPYVVTQSGSLMVAQVSTMNTSYPGGTDLATPSGWTLLGSHFYFNTRLSVFHRVSDSIGGHEMEVSTAEYGMKSAHVFEVVNWDGSTFPEISSAATGWNSMPDPPPVEASWGQELNRFVALVAANDRLWADSHPPGYAYGFWANANIGVSQGASYRLAYVGDDNPGTMSLSSSARWVSFTIVIRPGDSP